MSQREKILAALVGGLVLLMIGNWGLQNYRTKRDQNRSRQFASEQKLSATRAELARGLNAQKKLQQWQQQSLPSNTNIAKSLYQDWLKSQLTESGIQVEQLNDRSSPRARNKQYSQISFSISAEGSLDQLVVFLHRFYQSNHLHRIADAVLVPTKDRKSLSMTLAVDALVLPDTDRTDELASGSSERLADEAGDYQKRIESRNVFRFFSPNRSGRRGHMARPEGRGSEDKEADQAKLTGITHGQHGWRLAIRMEDSGKVRFFREGDPIKIGSIVGKIAELNGRQAIIETADQRLEVPLGQTLGQAKPLEKQAG